jgi:tRNA pseudouridine-54 N-methylase
VICCTKQAGWMAKSKVVSDYKLEHTNKELDGSLTSLLILARFFSSALMLHDRVHLPNVLVHSLACIIAPSTRCFRFELLSYSLASHASMIFLQNKALAAPHACTLHVV